MRTKMNRSAGPLPSDYFRPRDFEYAQPLYDLAYLLQIDALSREEDVPEYRSFALWKAAIGIDGYTTNVDTWLGNPDSSGLLDLEPSSRITAYLRSIRETGTLPELEALASPEHRGCLRLRAIRGLGLKQIAKALADRRLTDEWLLDSAKASAEKPSVLLDTWKGTAASRWEAAHVVPPLMRLLRNLDCEFGAKYRWKTTALGNGIEPVPGSLEVHVCLPESVSLEESARKVIGRDHFFLLKEASAQRAVFAHRMGWNVAAIRSAKQSKAARSVAKLAAQADAFLPFQGKSLYGDLHAHTNWSDGATPLQAMAETAKEAGWEYLAITDHSRSSKLQGGLTPVAWLRQDVSLSLLPPSLQILHGVEVDILSDGSLDLPGNLLAGMDLVVASVHSNWSGDAATDTARILKAVQSGRIDILGHPTATILGKPGVPTYFRPPVELDWERVFRACRTWSVAVEFNCFPSRLDLLTPLLVKASESGCWISFGTDAHSRAHLCHLKVAQRVLPLIDASRVLNLLPFGELKAWLKAARMIRKKAVADVAFLGQQELFPLQSKESVAPVISVRVAKPASVPAGSRIVGLDLTASKAKPTGVALLDGLEAQTCSLESDQDILAFIRKTEPAIVSIDSPLGLPGGGQEVLPDAGIVRVAENDLSSIGIPAYPALIDSMKPLTLRGIGLRRDIEALPGHPKVIESYPGAAQDILCIPRKQEGLDLLRAGLREFGLHGKGLDTDSHDEMDAITAAIVGRYYEIGQFEPMGVLAEAQLIVPKLQPLEFDRLPVICLSGRTGVGKSVVARYLALFYGFHWLRTRDLVRALLIDDLRASPRDRMYHEPVDVQNIKESDLTAFGIVMMERFQQVPLLKKLKEMVAATELPVVVDAVRDLADFEIFQKSDRAPMLWFVDAPDAMIQSRLANRQRFSKPSQDATGRIDQKTSVLRAAAHHCFRNDASLEDLRWSVDDTLFAALDLRRR